MIVPYNLPMTGFEPRISVAGSLPTEPQPPPKIFFVYLPLPFIDTLFLFELELECHQSEATRGFDFYHNITSSRLTEFVQNVVAGVAIRLH